MIQLVMHEGHLFVAVCLGDRVGLGEVAPLEGFSRETMEEARKAFETLPPEEWPPSLAWGVDSAWLQLEHLPLPTPSYSTLVTDPLHTEPFPFPCLKLKIGHLSVEEAVLAVHRFHPFTPRLRLDINCKWSLDQALAFSDAIDLPLDYIEEPVATFDGLCAFKEQSPHAIAIDEHLREASLEAICALKPHAAIIKPSLMGSLATLKALTEMLKGHGICPVLSTSFESPVGLYNLLLLHTKLELSDAPIGLP